MKILLVGNYVLDGQQSMRRFADVMAQGLRAEGHEVRITHPPVWLGRYAPSAAGVGKWLGYLDKYVCYLPMLAREARWADIVHVCDHSNAPYVFSLRGRPHLVTCHDLLAVRGGLGEQTDCPASSMGQLLQRAILTGLRASTEIVCDSASTRDDLIRIGGPGMSVKSRVVLLGLNQPFERIDEEESMRRLGHVSTGLLCRPFVLMVGSALRRKNRESALLAFHHIARHWDANLVIAGQQLTPAQRELASSLGILSRVRELVNPDHRVLEALYNRAHALLFPSRFEGFGWPIIEAQACGCPVVCSDATSIPEVAGEGTLMRNSEDHEGLAADVLSLREPFVRAGLVQRGHRNLGRFTTRRMIEEYVDAYRQVMLAVRRPPSAYHLSRLKPDVAAMAAPSHGNQ